MRILTAFRWLPLLIFALFGGALPVAASGDHVVICGADGLQRVAAYDFETGKPVEVEISEPECQDCFGAAPLPTGAPVFARSPAHARVARTVSAGPAASTDDVRLPLARAPPALIS